MFFFPIMKIIAKLVCKNMLKMLNRFDNIVFCSGVGDFIIIDLCLSSQEKMNLKKFITIEIEENNRCDLIKKIIYFSKKYNFNLDYVIINKNDSCKKKSYYKNIYGDFWRKKLFNNYLNLNKTFYDFVGNNKNEKEDFTIDDLDDDLMESLINKDVENADKVYKLKK